jgi:hypothetical protein
MRKLPDLLELKAIRLQIQTQTIKQKTNRHATSASTQDRLHFRSSL